MYVIISIQEKEMPYLLAAVTDEVLKTQQEGPTRKARQASANIRAEERSDRHRGATWPRARALVVATQTSGFVSVNRATSAISCTRSCVSGEKKNESVYYTRGKV